MITLNGTQILSPSELIEDYEQIQNDRKAIDGSLSRNRLGQKKIVSMVYNNIQVSDYRNILNLVTSGSGLVYRNDLSAEPGGIFTFSGLAVFEGGKYVPGSSLLKADFKVNIREY